MASEEGGSPTCFSDEVRALEARSRSLMRSQQYGSALKYLSQALLLAKSSEEKSSLLLTRSRAYTEMSTWLRGIPARDSEYSAISGLDPISLAELGLQDAIKVAALDPTVAKAHLQQGKALVLLEEFAKAKAQVMEGLSIDPLDQDLQKALVEVKQHLVDSRPSSPAPPQAAAPSSKRKARTVEDAECGLCMKLFYEPVTTPCGHTFCRNCFLRARDHNNRCPMCRTLVPVNREMPVTQALSQLIQSSFPEEYEARRQESLLTAEAQAGKEPPLSIFVMSNIFPGEEMSLNIFEPRYRLLIRRCLEGSRRFGLATVDRDYELQKVACEVEISECQAAPDGRFLIDIVGTRRFRVLNTWEQDGYRVAEPEYFTDERPEEGSAAIDEIKAAASAAIDSVTTMRDRIMACSRGQFPELPGYVTRGGEAATPESAENLSFWMAGLMQAVNRYDRLALLEATSTVERLRLLTARLNVVAEGLGEGRFRGCRIM